MDLALQDPFGLAAPEALVGVIAAHNYEAVTCIALNRRGTLLAGGTISGRILVWDMDTKSIRRYLSHAASTTPASPAAVDSSGAKAAAPARLLPLTAMAWSKLGHKLLSCARNGTLAVWDVLSSTMVTQSKILDNISSTEAASAFFHPYNDNLVLVNGNKGDCVLWNSTTNTQIAVGLPGEPSAFGSGGPAVFSRDGKLLYRGTTKGIVVVTEIPPAALAGKGGSTEEKGQFVAVGRVTGGQTIRNIQFSRKGNSFLVSSTDRAIRTYDRQDPFKVVSTLRANGLVKESNLLESFSSPSDVPVMDCTGEFKNVVDSTPWAAVTFSGNEMYIISAAAIKGQHRVAVWERDSRSVVRSLEFAKETSVAIVAHPHRADLFSLTNVGRVLIWSRRRHENWAAFAPDFEELEENVEYVEAEDEFDRVVRDNAPPPENMRAAVHATEAQQKETADNDADIDIADVEKIGVYSDTDDSTDAMYHLPLDYDQHCNEVESDMAAAPDLGALQAQNGGAGQGKKSGNGVVGTKGGTKRSRGGKAVS